MYQEQENHNFKEKRQSSDANTEMNEMLQFSEKDFKAAIMALIVAVTNDSRYHRIQTNFHKFISTNSIASYYKWLR